MSFIVKKQIEITNKAKLHWANKKFALINNITYILNERDKTACISNILIGNNNIFIPNTIDYNKKKYLITDFIEPTNSMEFVTSINFESNSNLQIINKNVFALSKIVKIEIPSSVKKICEYAFYQCFNLQEITFKNDSQLQIIENRAFYFSSLNSLIIPSNVNELQEGWCDGTWRLSNFIVGPKNPYYLKYEDNFLIGKSDKNKKNFDILILNPRNTTNAKIPFFIEQIGSFSFAISSLKSISIPSTVKVINKYAFANCCKLVKIEFSDNSQLEVIDDGAFFNSSIKSISIPSSVKFIGSFAFSECFSLQKVLFSNFSNLKKICQNAFSNSFLCSISIPQSVEEIGEYAFASCGNLHLVEINCNDFSKYNFNGKNIFFKSLKAMIIFSV